MIGNRLSSKSQKRQTLGLSLFYFPTHMAGVDTSRKNRVIRLTLHVRFDIILTSKYMTSKEI